MSNIEDKLKTWAKPPGKTEAQKCTNAEQVIRNALKAYKPLQDRNFSVLVKGSYAANTNLSTKSDVDVAVILDDVFFYDLPQSYSASYFGITPAIYSFADFKLDVERAIINYLGPESVTSGTNALDVHQNSYRVDADVVPCVRYRRYEQSGRY